MNNNSIFQSFLSICYKRPLTESVTDIINNYLINLAYEKLNDKYIGNRFCKPGVSNSLLSTKFQDVLSCQLIKIHFGSEIFGIANNLIF